MAQLSKEFADLGFDLLGMNSILYLGVGPIPKPDDCLGGQCTVSCTNGCASCRPGNKN
jgi:hypothetical protein